MEHFGAVFKLDLTEETRTQLQEEAMPHTGYAYTLQLVKECSFDRERLSLELHKMSVSALQ